MTPTDAEILAEARRAWDEINAWLPKFTRQTWEQGTLVAKCHQLQEAERRLIERGGKKSCPARASNQI